MEIREATRGESKNMLVVSVLFLLFFVFLILKLTGIIAWSWWIVTLPLSVIIFMVMSIFLAAVIWIILNKWGLV